MPMESQMLNNRYKLLAQIAAGGMALVYKAQDTMLNRIVAVKILRESFAEDPAFQKRFMREAQSAANLSHPNIVTVYDFGRDGDRQYIVMEYVEGRDLKSVIRAEGPLPLARALNIAEQICAGVGAAHRIGIVHCDVKPQNVILTPEGQAKVTDFGIARAFFGGRAGRVHRKRLGHAALFFAGAGRRLPAHARLRRVQHRHHPVRDADGPPAV